MEKIERAIRTWIATQDERQVAETVSEISAGSATFVSVVKALGEYLTSEEDSLRTKGVEFLSAVLEGCSPASFNRRTVRVLVAFYCGKLEDTETIVPALAGLVTLSSLPQFTSNDAIDVAKAIFSHVKMKALTVRPRFAVFTIIDSLVGHHRDGLKTMGSEFIAGYVNLAEGEKDPRNLFLAFSIDRVIIIEFDVSAHIEAFFDITFCYFPIGFRPPPEDPYGISPEQLKDRLLECFNATPAFGPLAIDLFVEKLTAGSPVTKRDTLKALNLCLPVYGTTVAQKNARKLWNSLKLEIFQPTDPLTEEAALITSQVLIKTIYNDDKDDLSLNEDIQGLAREACEECLQILKEPEKSQAKPAIKVMCAFMSTTPSVSRYTLSQAAPHLIKLFHNPDEISNRASVLMLLGELVEAARNSTIATDAEEAPLAPYKDEVLGVFTVGLKAFPSRQAALDGMKSMVKTGRLLTDEELGFIVHNVNEVLQAEEDSDETSDSLIALLSSISSFAPRHITETTLPILFSSLPDETPSRGSGSERAKYWHTLALLTKLCVQQSLFETLVIRLSTKLDLICTPRSGSSTIDIEASAAYAHSILRTLASVLSVKVAARHPDIPKYLDRLVLPLYHLFISSALLASNEHDAVATDRRLLVVAGQIISSVTQVLSVQKQEPFARSLITLFMTGDLTQIASGGKKFPSDVQFRPLELDAPTLQKNLIVLLSSAVVPLHQEVSLFADQPAEFLGRLLKWSVHGTDNTLQREGAWHILASMLNKRVADLSSFFSSTVSSFWDSEIASTSVLLEHRQHGISAWVWIVQALLVRSDPASMKLAERLFELFSDTSIGWDAASAIGRITASNTVLTKQNYAVVKLLYAQKFANPILPRIIAGAQSSPQPQEQTAHLVALSSLIKSIPKTIYADKMPTLMPLLLRGLDLPNDEIRANVIDTLLATADPEESLESKQNSLVSEHATSLVSIMLKNSMASDTPSPRVRSAALRYLGVLPSVVRYDVLHPQKNIVLRELAKCLDDPKKSVRREAVDTRTKWFQYAG